MAWTQTDIDKLRRAIGSGALKVRFDGEEVTFRSLSEMKDLLAMMERDVLGDSTPRVSVATFSPR